jgi:hypothetical protein
VLGALGGRKLLLILAGTVVMVVVNLLVWCNSASWRVKRMFGDKQEPQPSPWGGLDQPIGAKDSASNSTNRTNIDFGYCMRASFYYFSHIFLILMGLKYDFL